MIPKDQALSAGAQLWMLPFDPEAFWFKKINWYLKFLLHTPNKTQAPTEPLLVQSQGLLPNEKVLCLPSKDEDWISNCYQHWKQFNKPSLRLFLPSSLNFYSLNEAWPDTASTHKLTCAHINKTSRNL